MRCTMETKHSVDEPVPCCVRCGSIEAYYTAAVHCNSIYQKTCPCAHGPFCERCVQKKDAQTLPQCECRALISDWIPIKPGIGPPRLGVPLAGLYPQAPKLPNSPGSAEELQPRSGGGSPPSSSASVVGAGSAELAGPAAPTQGAAGRDASDAALTGVDRGTIPNAAKAAADAVAQAAQAAAARRAERAAQRAAAEASAATSTGQQQVPFLPLERGAPQAYEAVSAAGGLAAGPTPKQKQASHDMQPPTPSSLEKPGTEHAELLIRSSRGAMAPAPVTPAATSHAEPRCSPSPFQTPAFQTPQGFATPLGVTPLVLAVPAAAATTAASSSATQPRSSRMPEEAASRSLAEALRSRGGRSPIQPPARKGRWLPFCQLWP